MKNIDIKSKNHSFVCWFTWSTFLVVYLLFESTAAVYAKKGFVETGELNTPISGHSSILLADGRVISIGETVEIYDPETEEWTIKQSMNQPRFFQSTTLLTSNKILVAGGATIFENTFTPLASAEIYDIATDTWSNVGAMLVPRSEAQATLLPNGKVLVTAGDTTGFAPLASAEIFDPVLNTWSSAGTMTDNRSRHRQVLLDNGEVLVAGGRDNTDISAPLSVDIYSPDTNSWRSAASMINGHYSGAMVKLLDGTVLMATGVKQNPASSFASLDHTGAEIYDPVTDSWQATGPLNFGRRSSRFSLLCDGRVMVSGGFNGSSGLEVPVIASAEVYDPVEKTWEEVGPMPVERTQHTSTRLTNCDILIAGGQSNEGTLLNSILYTDLAEEDELCLPIKASNDGFALVCL